MKITHAELTISAVEQTQYPQDTLPEIALAGRSNVGKSAFINRLIQRKKLARTSSQPGKTQTLNFYQLNNAFYIVDVPGYGYAKVSKRERMKWGPMMEEYFETRDELQAVILLTDIRHDPAASDQHLYDYVKYLGYPVIVVATKADKIKKSKYLSYIQQSKAVLELDASDIIIPFSAVTSEGYEDAWEQIEIFL